MAETEARLSSHLDADIRALAAIERPSASPGEEAAARWVKSAEPQFATIHALRNVPFATDALVATRRGLPAFTVASLNDEGYVPHYHWPSDTPENVDLRSVEEAYAFCNRLIRRLAERA